MYLPEGRPPRIGEVLKHEDLARTLRFLVNEEQAYAGRGRLAGLAAVRRAFYEGDIAACIADHQKENGGLLTARDMARFRVGIEPAVSTTFGPIEVRGCGPWCQGPMLLQALGILEGMDLEGMGHNSVDYLHTLAEAINLAAADRHGYYGDPRFVDVPIETLLSNRYAAGRRALIRPDRAFGKMPPPGTVDGHPPGPGPYDAGDADDAAQTFSEAGSSVGRRAAGHYPGLRRRPLRQRLFRHPERQQSPGSDSARPRFRPLSTGRAGVGPIPGRPPPSPPESGRGSPPTRPSRSAAARC